MVYNTVISNETSEIPIDCKKKLEDPWQLEIMYVRNTDDLDLPLNAMPGFKLEWDDVDNYTKTNNTVETYFSR